MKESLKYHEKKFRTFTDLKKIKPTQNKWLLDLMIKKEFESMEEFCEFAEVSKEVIRRYLFGSVKTLHMATQEKLAEALDVDCFYIMKMVAKNEL